MAIYETGTQGTGKRFVQAVGMLTCLLFFQGARAETVLYSFSNGVDGGHPFSGVIRDHAGNLYGTTDIGGNLRACGANGCGVVYRIAPDGTETVLYSFNGGKDGGFPRAGLTMDASQNLYGTTYEGGGSGCNGSGCGTIFKLSPDGSETVLYSFTGKADGAQPTAGLILDGAGNLYGTTGHGANRNCSIGGVGCGTVFKLAPNGGLSTLYSFTGGADGASPFAGVVMDRHSSLYGAAEFGGDSNCKCGTVFKIASDGQMTVLHTFTGGEGSYPISTPIVGRRGNIYGTANSGPGLNCGGVGCGTVFKIARDNTLTVLHAFTGSDDGSGPSGSLMIDKAGNLYGTTAEGGHTEICAGGCGTVYKVEPDGTETVLYTFQETDGDRPMSGVIADKKGHLFGTTQVGGAYLSGNVFELTP